MARCCYTEKGTRAMSFDEKLEEARDGEGSMKINEMEQTKVSLMRTYVESQDPSSRDPSSQKADDLMIRRFLRARDLDVEKASALFLRYLKWRQTFVPNGSISLSQVRNEVAQNKMFLQGLDKQGRPISVVLGAKHFQYQGSLDEFKLYAFDKICTRMPPGQEKFVVIGDLEGWGYSNSDMRAYLGALSILQDYYPERLGKLFIIHAPYIFMAIWKIVYPFIDKIPRRRSTLLEEIDESQLPQIYGGKLPLVPIQDS
ncbi:hypothetical protein AAG906_025628 [Vitis piasezkii]